VTAQATWSSEPGKIPLIVQAQCVQLMSAVSGFVEVTTTKIAFVAHVIGSKTIAGGAGPGGGAVKGVDAALVDRLDFELPLANLREIHARRYVLVLF
jgi:hypothetical protein